MNKDLRREVFNFIITLVGLAIAAFGVVAFVLTNGIIIGSATGIGRIVQHLYGLPVSYTVLAVDTVLFFIGLAALGKRFALSTLIASFSYPLFINIFEHFDFTVFEMEDMLIATLCGGVTIGIGMGLVLRYGASTGGTDIIAIVLNKKKGLPLGTVLYIVDISILVTQILFVDSFEQIIMGVVLTVLYSTVTDKVVSSGQSATQFIIISDKYEELRDMLTDKVVGVTLLRGETGYRRNETDVLLCVLPKNEVVKVKNAILDIDDKAFITISTIKEVRGRGYSFDIGKAKELRSEKIGR